MTLKMLILTDLHLTVDGADIIGLDPWVRFEAALDHALSHHSDADAMILSGDLTHYGDAAAYTRLAQRLKDVPLPVVPLPGNHDKRAPMIAAFPAETEDDGFFHRIIETEDIRLIALDTLDEAAPDKHSGHLCRVRRAWLDQALNTAKRKIVITHHPLALTGFDGMDAIRLRDADLVTEVLKSAGTELVISGHIHRTISGVWRGLPFAIVKSPCHQMPMRLGPERSDVSSAEPGGYGIVLIEEDGVIVHTSDTEDAPVIAEKGSATPEGG